MTPYARLAYVFGHLRVNRRTLTLIVVLSLAEAVPVVFSGWLVAKAVDKGFLHHRPGLGVSLLMLYALLEVGRAGAERQLLPQLANVVEPMRDSLVAAVVSTSIHRAAGQRTSHNNEPDSAVLARLTGHVETTRAMAGALLRLSRQVVVSVVAALVGLAAVAPTLLLVVLPPLLLASCLYPISWAVATRRRRAAVLAEEQVAAVTGKLIRSSRDVIATGGCEHAVAELRATSEVDVRARNAMARLVAVRATIDTIGGRLPVIAILLTAPVLVRHHAVTPGELLGAITYLNGYLSPAVSSLNGAVNGYGTQLAAVIDRLRETTSVERSGVRPAASTGRGGSLDPTAAPTVQINQVTFRYGAASAPVLHGLTFEILEHDHLAIIGSSGSGKSTLAALIAGIDEPEAGQVLIGGRPATSAWAAGETALVPQAAYLFADTVRANLSYLNESATPEDLLRAAGELGATELIYRLGGLDAAVEPAQLSNGEKQLLVLTRVYVSSGRVVILDEATSHLDALHEELVEAAFSRRGGSLIVVAHRLSSAARARQVLLLGGDGAITGSHHELLLSSEGYAAFAAGETSVARP